MSATSKQPIYTDTTSTHTHTTPTMFTTPPTGLQPKTVWLSYYAAGRHQLVGFDTTSPDFRLAILTLNEQHRPFRIIYN